MAERSMIQTLDLAIEKLNGVINTAEVALLSDEISGFDEAMLELGDLHKRLKNLSNMIGGNSES